MPGLKFLIDGDDRPLLKKLAALPGKIASQTKASAKVANDAIQSTTAKTRETTKAVDQQTEALKKRNREAAKRPVDFGNSAAEIAAAKAGQVGNIKSGTVAGNHAELGKLANAATAASGAQTRLAVETTKTTVAQKAQSISIDDLTARLAVYKEAQGRATDPVLREKYNKRIEETTVQINRMSNAGKTGFDELGNKIEGTTGKIDRLRRVAAGYRLMADSSKDIKQIEVFNAKAQQAAGAASRLSNVGKKGFDEMGNAVKGSTSLFSKAISGIMRMAYLLPGIGVAGLLAFAIDPIVNYLSKLDLFNKKVAEAVKSKRILAETQLLGAQNAQSEITNLKLLTSQYQNTNLPLKQRKEAYAELQKQYPAYFANISFEAAAAGKTKEAYDRLTQSIIATAKARAMADKIAENASRMLSDEEKITDLREKQLKAREAELRAKEKLDLNSGVADIASGRQDKFVRAYLSAQEKREALDREINNLYTDRNILNERNLKLEESINKEVKKGGKTSGDVGGKDTSKSAIAAENQYQSALAKRLDLQNAINAASEEAVAKNLLEEDSELAASEAKYKKMREDIIEFNNWAENYNKTHLNKIAKVDVSQVDAIEQNDRDAILDKQAQEEFDKNQVLLKEFQSYTDKRLHIQKTGLETATKLRQLGDDAAAQEAITRAHEEITALDEANVQKLVSYKQLFDNTEELSRKATKVYIEELQKELDERLAAGTITVEAYKKVQSQITKLNKALKDDYVEGFYKAADALGNIANQMHGIDDAFAKTLGTISNVVGGFGDLMKHRNAMNAPGASGFDKALGAAGMVGAGIGIVKSIVSIFDKSEEKRRRAAEQQAYSQQLQLKAINAQTQALQRQLELIKDIYGAERIQAYAKGLDDIKKKQKELTEQLSTRALGNSNKLESDFIAKYNAGDKNALYLIDKERGERLKKQYEELEKKRRDYDRTHTGFGQQYNFTQDESFLRLQYHEFQKYSSIIENATKLKGKSIEELTDLMNRGLLDDQTSEIVKNLQELEKQYTETLNTMRAETTGTTFSSIADEIVQMFANGTTAAEDFGKNFDAMMQKYVLNKFKGDLMAGQLQKFYEKFAEDAKDGLTTDEINGSNGLRTMYDAIIANSQKQFEDLQKATGIGFGTGAAPSTPTGLSGVIRREMTEATASELTGLFRGQYDVTKRILTAKIEGNSLQRQSLDIAMGSIRHMQAIEAHTFRGANNTDLLNTKLDAIITNTKPTITGRGLGAP